MLAHYTRQEFFSERWAPEPGEQVFVVQPTQGGKTHFAFDLLNSTDHRKPPVALVMKPKDPTPAKMTRRWAWKEIDRWPPPRRWPWEEPPPGYTLWPKHALSLDAASLEKTDRHIQAQFERCLMGAYKTGDQVIFADEIHGLLAELKMEPVVRRLSNRGAGANAVLWYATQKPSGSPGAPMPGYLFNNPRHLFLGADSVAANRKRFSEIGGINTALVMEEVERLETMPVRTPGGMKYPSQLLYINKNGPRGGWMCIVEPF